MYSVIWFVIAIHLIFLYSIFDLYFNSPIINSLNSVNRNTTGICSRLVLIVSDGLRSDHLFNRKDVNHSTVFLRSIALNEGVWGLSHTHVPTESRPGHVTLIAGIYEDITAIFKGWKENPIAFDSTFNQSRDTWAWGSPDIVNMFSRGNVGNNIHSFSYHPNFQDFASPNPRLLDEWVFTEVSMFFNKSLFNKSMGEKVRQDKVILFLHLLGMDTSGHIQKPQSDMYKANLHYLDMGLEMIVKEIADFYGDDKTCYLFTADHGMTNWGSHGSGSNDETITPFLAWGAGIRKPASSKNAKETSTISKFVLPFYNDEELMSKEIVQFEQADIAPLISCLLGIPIPVNSVGRVPIGIINDTIYERHCLSINTMQIYQQYSHLHEHKKANSLERLFVPFKKHNSLQQALDRLEEDLPLHSHSYYTNLIDICFEGIKYYRRYDLVPLEIVMATSYVAWILCILIYSFVDFNVKPNMNTTKNITRFTAYSLIIAFTILLFLYMNGSSPMFFLYYTLPIFLSNLLYRLIAQRRAVVSGRYFGLREYLKDIMLPYVFALCSIAFIIAAFYERSLTILLLLTSVITLGMLNNTSIKISHTPPYMFYKSLLLYALLCPFYLLKLPGEYKASIVINVCAWFVYMLDEALNLHEVYALKNKKNLLKKISWNNKITFLTAIMSCLMYATCRTCDSSKAIRLLFINLPSWLLIIGPLGVLLKNEFYDGKKVSKCNSQNSLTFFNLFLFTYFSLLSISYEFLFLVLLNALLKTLLNIYTRCDSNLSEHHSPAKVIMCRNFLNYMTIHFVSFLFIAFFGIGNLASISSFDPSYVLCFLSVFAPFTMTILILVKILVPFVLITIHTIFILKALTNDKCEEKRRAFFINTLLLFEVMGLYFYFSVRTEGSWLDIGSSLSHYIISNSIFAFILLVYYLIDAMLNAFKISSYRKVLKNSPKLL